MVIINTVSDKYFSLNGVNYAKIYQPLKQGSESVGIYNVYDTRQQLLDSTRFNEIEINGTVYGSQSATIAAILSVTFNFKIQEDITTELALKTDKGGYEGTAQDLKDEIDGVLSGVVGTLAIADEPTEDGIYYASESGTYTNAGGLVVDLSAGINIISVEDGQAVFELVVIPVDLSSQLSNEIDVLNTSQGYTPRGAALGELSDIFIDKSVVVSVDEWNTVKGLVDFWVDDPSKVVGLEFRIRALYIDDPSFSDRFGVKEITENVNIWSHILYGEMDWGDRRYKYITLPYKETVLNFVWDISKLVNVGTYDSYSHKLIINAEPQTALGVDLSESGAGLVIATLGDSITMNFSTNVPSVPATCGDHDNQNWNALKRKIGFRDIINIGIGGAEWQDRGDENITNCPLRATSTGTASNCIRMLKRLIAEGRRSPHIITFAFGTNNPVADGDYNTVMGMTFAQLEADEVYRQTMYGGLRYNLEVVTRDFPKAQIVLLCPMQAAEGSRPIEGLKATGDAIKEMGRRYGCSVIDLYGELGVVSFNENAGAGGRYLSDGIHLNDDGKKLYTDFFAKKLKEVIIKRPV